MPRWSRSRMGDPHGEVLEAPEVRCADPHRRLEVDFDLGGAGGQVGNGDAGEDAGQWCADAEVGAMAEPEMTRRDAVDVEAIGIREHARVAVGGADVYEH